jgi:hypothetical protein
MTTLIAWLGVDERQPASIYIATDSRISWGNSHSWDVGQKIFSALTKPELFAFCGDVIYPQAILPRICSLIDEDNFFAPNSGYDAKLNQLFDYVQRTFSSYPLKGKFTILYISREHDGMAATFHAGKISWDSQVGFEMNVLMLPSESELIVATGTGKLAMDNKSFLWQNSDAQGTSRSVFSAFCDALASGADQFSGGAPQLAGLYRIGASKQFGIIWNEIPYINGVEAAHHQLNDLREWRNNLFERCSPDTLTVIANAQKHPRPLSIRS